MHSSFYYTNRNKLKKLTKSKLIVISANWQIQKSLDQPYTFKQDNNFLYLTGLDEPQLILVIAENEEFLITPAMSKSKEIFDGSISSSELTKTSGITHILSQQEGYLKLSSLMAKHKTVATLVPKSRALKAFGIYPAPARKALIDLLKRLTPSVKIEDITKELAGMRIVKTNEELANIKKAIGITTDTLSEALDKHSLSSLSTAKQLEAVINFGFVSRGASSMSFDPIIAQGKQATTIHYIKNDQKLNNKDLLLIDVGCEYNHYASDISRTISLSKPSPRQAAVFNAVKEVQAQAIKLVKSGILMKDFENEVESLIGRQLINLNLIKSPSKKAIRKYYPHSVSHSLGLDVHDLADLSKPLPEGSVITVEPGIYIPEESLGVRLEDDVLVTSDGCQVLSKSLPSRLW